MARELTTALKNETQAAKLRPALFAYFDFQSGPVRVWTGIGPKAWDGHTWQGLGALGEISPIEESADIKANGVTFQLSGVPSALIATVLGDNYSGRPVKVWVAALNSARGVVADPYMIFSGRMDNVEIDEGPVTSVIRVNAESRLVDLQRSKEWRYTHEAQQLHFPGDRGLEFMATAASTPFLWGDKPVATAASGVTPQQIASQMRTSRT